MERRGYLIAAGTMLGLAGCTGSNDSPNGSNTATTTSTDSPTESPTPTETDTPTQSPTEARPNEAEDLIEEAWEHLQTAGDTFDKETETMYSASGVVSFDIEPIYTALENGRDDLDEASEVTTDEQQMVVEVLRSYADYIQALTDTLEAIADVYNHFSTAGSYEEAGRFKSGADELRAANEAVGTAEEHHQTAADIQAELSANALEENEVAWSETKVWVDEIGGIITGLSILAEGGIAYDEAAVDYNEGVDAYNDEQYSAASNAFEEAVTHYRTAHETYRSGEDDAPQSMKSRVITKACETGIYRDATIEYRMASDAAEVGNYSEARAHIEEGEEILNQSC